MSSEIVVPSLAPPFERIFADYAEAEWGFGFLRQTIDLLNAGANAYRPCVLTLPKNHKQRLLRFNFGPWLLVDFCGPTSKYGKWIHLALLRDGLATASRKEWFVFSHPHDKRGMAVYRFTWAEVQSMDSELTEHYEVSMQYTGELFGHWRGSAYQLAHQPQLFAGIFDPALRASILTHGLDPFFRDSYRSEDNNEDFCSGMI